MAHSTSKSAQASPTIDTQPLRDFLAAISKQALTSLNEASPEISMKMSSAAVALTKAICEAEAHNLKCTAASGADAATASGSLQARLKGYVPTKKELKELEATLRQRLDTLAPRLANESAEGRGKAEAQPNTPIGARHQDPSR